MKKLVFLTTCLLVNSAIHSLSFEEIQKQMYTTAQASYAHLKEKAQTHRFTDNLDPVKEFYTGCLTKDTLVLTAAVLHFAGDSGWTNIKEGVQGIQRKESSFERDGKEYVRIEKTWGIPTSSSPKTPWLISESSTEEVLESEHDLPYKKMVAAVATIKAKTLPTPARDLTDYFGQFEPFVEQL